MHVPLSRFKLFFLFGLTLSLPVHGDEKREIRIGSYNVENFWDGDPENTPAVWDNFLSHANQNKSARYAKTIQYSEYAANSSNWYDPSILATKAEHFLETLEIAEYPDILALQEIESAGNQSKVLEIRIHNGRSTLGEELHRLGYDYWLLGNQSEDKPVSVTPAFVSKIKIIQLPNVRIDSEEFPTSARDLQVVEAQFGKERLVLFNGHWKSKIGGAKGELERIQIADRLKSRIAQEKEKSPNTKIIVLGDINTAYWEKPLAELGSTGDETLMLSSAPTEQLYNLWYDLPEADRWEISFGGERGNLSQMLLSDALYTQYGLHYVPKSFRVIGHEGKAKEKLVNAANGRPFHWQVQKNFNFAKHIGKGYSDHLPLVATFTWVPYPSSGEEIQNPKLVVSNPSHETESHPPQKILFDQFEPCTAEQAKDIDTLNIRRLEDYIGTCIKVESQETIALETMGKYRTNYIHLGNSVRLGLVMVRNYDWRPNIDDSRVTLESASIPADEYNFKNAHPRSNQCFTRKVLQGPGGNLKFAVGRLGYNDGLLSLHIASREENYLVLTDLPQKKIDACPW